MDHFVDVQGEDFYEEGIPELPGCWTKFGGLLRTPSFGLKVSLITGSFFKDEVGHYESTKNHWNVQDEIVL